MKSELEAEVEKFIANHDEEPQKASVSGRYHNKWLIS